MNLSFLILDLLLPAARPPFPAQPGRPRPQISAPLSQSINIRTYIEYRTTRRGEKTTAVVQNWLFFRYMIIIYEANHQPAD